MVAPEEISFLISTMHRHSLDFLDAMFPYHDWTTLNLVIVNQSENTNLESGYPNHLIINSNDYGLSKSRNLALKHCKTKFAVIADDDVQYFPNCLTTYKEAIEQYSDFAILLFKSVYECNDERKKYPIAECEITLPLKHYKPSSIEFMLNLSILNTSKLQFNPRFGLGARYKLGEEEVFLIDALKEKFKAIFIPLAVVKHPRLSSGSKKSNFNYLETQLIIHYLNHGTYTYLWLFKYTFYIWRKKLQSEPLFSLMKRLWVSLKEFRSLEKN